MNPHPNRLQRKSVPKPWGRLDLPHPFEGAANEQIGEVWFDDAGAEQDLLVKYLFTSDKLSIQVHPCDELARLSGLASGKEFSSPALKKLRGGRAGLTTKPCRCRAKPTQNQLWQLYIGVDRRSSEINRKKIVLLATFQPSIFQFTQKSDRTQTPDEAPV